VVAWIVLPRGLWTLVALSGVALAACRADTAGAEAGASPDAAAGSTGERLSATGLYADPRTGALGEGVREFRPRFELWADGATKRRWLWLPPGTQIDTSDMDAWRFPVGTKIWKEFTRDGVRVETRLLRKDGPRRTDWKLVAYVWDGARTDAVAAPDGQPDALGTPHDVPETKACKACHDGAADTVIGVSAIQLDHDGDGLTLARLASGGLLTAPPARRYDIPGNPVEAGALGYLHANCGHCHNERAVGPAGVLFRLDLTVGSLGSVKEAPVFRTAIGAPTRVKMPLEDTTATQLIVPGDPEASLLHIRMLRRGSKSGQMPTVGSEVVDREGSDAVAAWIRSLAP
jgi:mono/diheme cytochrome c family protein